MKIDLEKISEVLNHVPDVKESKESTMLDIAGYPDYENVISNIYAFFLDEKGEHGYGRLFITALMNLLPESLVKNGLLEEYTVSREYPTDKKGRIDIVILSNQKPKKVKPFSIFIENKIHAQLNNDLKDYASTMARDYNSIGIVLTLKKTSVDAGLTNITHKQWAGSIQKLLETTDYDVSDKYRVFLNDFLSHINSYTMKAVTKKQLQYVSENREALASVQKLTWAVIEHFQSEVRKIGDYSELKKVQTRGDWASIRYTDFPIFLYLYFDDFIQSGKFLTELWIKEDDSTSNIKRFERNKRIKEISGKHGINKLEETAYGWIPIGYKHYPLDADDAYNFNQYIIKTIEKDWMELMSHLKYMMK